MSSWKSRGAARRALVAAGLVLAGASPAWAADAGAGREKAKACTPCHGPLGVSVNPEAPNLAGQPEAYVAAQLRAYRSGRRTHEIMSVMAKPLTDAEIDGLAAWFASIAVEAKPPRP